MSTSTSLSSWMKSYLLGSDQLVIRFLFVCLFSSWSASFISSIKRLSFIVNMRVLLVSLSEATHILTYWKSRTKSQNYNEVKQINIVLYLYHLYIITEKYLYYQRSIWKISFFLSLHSVSNAYINSRPLTIRLDFPLISS